MDNYTRSLEMIIHDTWYYWPKERVHELPITLRSRAQEIHKRMIAQEPVDDHFYGKDGEFGG